MGAYHARVKHRRYLIMSHSAYHDGNGTHTLITVETDGKTLINIQADPVTHALHVSNGASGSDNGPTTSFHDASHIAILMATSNADGRTPVAVYGDTSGNLLVEAT